MRCRSSSEAVPAYCHLITASEHHIMHISRISSNTFNLLRCVIDVGPSRSAGIFARVRRRSLHWRDCRSHEVATHRRCLSVVGKCERVFATNHARAKSESRMCAGQKKSAGGDDHHQRTFYETALIRRPLIWRHASRLHPSAPATGNHMAPVPIP